MSLEVIADSYMFNLFAVCPVQNIYADVYAVYHIVTDSYISAGSMTAAFYSEAEASAFLNMFVGSRQYISGGPLSDYTLAGESRTTLGNITVDQFLIIPFSRYGSYGVKGPVVILSMALE